VIAAIVPLHREATVFVLFVAPAAPAAALAVVPVDPAALTAGSVGALSLPQAASRIAPVQSAIDERMDEGARMNACMGCLREV
jgi:hypothetical protein